MLFPFIVRGRRKVKSTALPAALVCVVLLTLGGASCSKHHADPTDRPVTRQAQDTAVPDLRQYDSLMFAGILRDQYTTDSVEYRIFRNHVGDTMWILSGTDTLRFGYTTYDSCVVHPSGRLASLFHNTRRYGYLGYERAILRVHGGRLRIAFSFLDREFVSDELVGLLGGPDSPAWQGDGSSNIGGVESIVKFSDDGSRVSIEQEAPKYTLRGKDIKKSMIRRTTLLEYDPAAGYYFEPDDAVRGPRDSITICPDCYDIRRKCRSASRVRFVRLLKEVFAYDGCQWLCSDGDECFCPLPDWGSR